MNLKTLLLALSLSFSAACSKGGGSGSPYSNVMTGSYETSASFSFIAQKVTFTISWNETNGTVNGHYKDDYFAPNGIAISGSVTNGGTGFAISLPAEKDGVSTIAFNIGKQGDKTIASITGLSSTGATVFADNDVELRGTAAGSTGSGDPASVAAFFDSIAGEYEWIATRSGGSDDQWAEGKAYKVSITKDQKITLPSEKGAIEFVFGSEAADSFESYDHEAYIIAIRGDCRILIQYQKGDDEPFLTCSKGNEITSPFWKFSTKGGASTGVMANLGMGGAVGEFRWVVTTAHAPEGTPDIVYTRGAELKFKIDADANIKSDLGDFTYSQDNFSQVASSGNGGNHMNSKWFEPSKTAVPRKEFIIDANETELKTLIIKDVRAENVTVTYVIAKSL